MYFFYIESESAIRFGFRVIGYSKLPLNSSLLRGIYKNPEFLNGREDTLSEFVIKIYVRLKLFNLKGKTSDKNVA